MHFCSHLCAQGKIFWSTTHLEIVLGQEHLTPEIFKVGPTEERYTGEAFIIPRITKNLIKVIGP
jgi:hypothetical protein